MRRGALALLVTLALVLLSGCAPSQPPPEGSPPAAGDELTPTAAAATTYVMAGDDYGYPSPFAFYSRGPGYIRMSYLFDTLVWKDADGVIPWLAERWALSDDGTAWTFELRPDVTWHDGQPLTAEDVAFSYTYFGERAAEGMVRWGWPIEHVAAAEASADGRTVTLHTAEPVAGLLSDLFGSLPIIPRHIWQGVAEPLKKLDAEAVIGSGPFILRAYDQAEGRYLYEANPRYFMGAPKVEQLALIRVQDAALALLVGDVHEASFSGSGIASVTELREQPGLAVIEGPSDWALKLYYNTTRTPFDRREVRQALALAIDRQALVTRAQLGGAVVASIGLLSPSSPWHAPNLPAYAHDAAAAQALLSAAGVTSLQTTLLTTPTYAREAELIRSDLAAVGITVEVRTADMATVDGLLNAGEFDLLVTGHGGTANPDMGHPSVPAVWENTEYTEVYEASLRAMDEGERRALVWRLQEIIAEELPILPLWHPLMWEVYTPGGPTPFYTAGGVANGIPLAVNKLMFLNTP